MKNNKLINKNQITFVESIPMQYSERNIWWEYRKSRKGNFFRKARPSGFTDFKDFIEKDEFLASNPNLVLGEGNQLYEIPKVLIHLSDGSAHATYFSTYEQAKDFAFKITIEMDLI